MQFPHIVLQSQHAGNNEMKTTTLPYAGVSAYPDDTSNQRLNIITVRKALESKQKGSYQTE